MLLFSSTHSKSTLYALKSIFFLLLLPQLAQAEAFKGGFLSSGGEKALFFILLLLGLLILVSTPVLLVATWEWLQTGKTTKLKKYLPRIVGALILGFVLLILAFLLSF